MIHLFILIFLIEIFDFIYFVSFGLQMRELFKSKLKIEINGHDVLDYNLFYS